MIMKSLSVFITLLLIVMASQLAARMRKSGSLPAENPASQNTVLQPAATQDETSTSTIDKPLLP
jgi:hypothetical protein